MKGEGEVGKVESGEWRGFGVHCGPLRGLKGIVWQCCTIYYL